MNIVITEGYEELSFKAAALIAEVMDHNRNPVLGLATGSTPEGMYRVLVEMYRSKQIDFGDVVTFNLDDYVGISPEHPQSYQYYMFAHLFRQVNIKLENVHLPSCQEEESQMACISYDDAIKAAGGIDIQVLGIGSNGHVGFNEPGEKLSVRTHITDLAEETIIDNSRFFQSRNEVPRQAITMGMGAIMQARKIVLLAYGRKKADALRNSVNGAVTTRVPASLLQLHNNITIIADRDAACLLD